MTVASELALSFCVELKTEEVWHGPKLKISHPLFTSSISFPNPLDFPLWNTERRCGRQGPKKKKERNTLYRLFFCSLKQYDISHFYSVNSAINYHSCIFVCVDLSNIVYLFIYPLFFYYLSFFIIIIPNFYIYIYPVNVCFISSKMFLGIEIRSDF